MRKHKIKKIRDNYSKLYKTKNNRVNHVRVPRSASVLEKSQEMIFKSVSLIAKVSTYERDLDRLNAVVLKYNPVYKLKSKSDYSERISKKMGEYIKIKELADKGKITKGEHKELLLQKQKEVESMEREINKIIINGSYTESLQRDFVNSMVETIYYDYFDDEGNKINSGGIMYRDATESHKQKILSKIYEENQSVRELFPDSDVFVKGSIKFTDQYDYTELERLIYKKKHR